MTTSTPQPGQALGSPEPAAPAQGLTGDGAAGSPTAPDDADAVGSAAAGEASAELAVSAPAEADAPSTVEATTVDGPDTAEHRPVAGGDEPAGDGEPSLEPVVPDPQPGAVVEAPPRAGDWSDLIWRVGFPVAMALLILAIPILLLTGRAVVLGSTDGAMVERVMDPTAPGWEALATPTPTMLLVQTDGERLVSAALLSLTGPEAGAVVLVPIDTVPPGGDRTIAELQADGPDAVRGAVETVLGAGVGEVETLGPDSWAAVLGPVAPLTVANPDDVYGTAAAGGRGPLRFAKGEVQLPATDVAAYLSTRSTGESDLNRMVRQDAFWEAWLAAVRAKGAGALPGEQESGLGRFVGTLAAGRVEVETLPVRKRGANGAGAAERFEPVADQVQALVARVVPFPVGAPPGARPRVKLLDGVGTLDHGLVAAAPLVGAGAELVQIGNAPAFGVGTTRLVYDDDDRRDEVEALARALGVGEIVKETDLGGGMDVVITLGQDWAAQPAPTTAAGSVPPATGAIGD